MKAMKSTMTIALALAFLILSGCNEISKLKDLLYPYTETHRGIGVYQEGKLTMFQVDLKGGFAYFDSWDSKTNEDLTWYALKDGKYWYEEGYYIPARWDGTQGIMGRLVRSVSKEITKKEFMKAVKPMARVLIECGIDPLLAMKSAAKELGLIKRPGVLPQPAPQEPAV